MKKIILILFLTLISSPCYAIANFTRASGVFLVPNVSVDNTTNYDSMTLQLDLGSGIFNVVDAVPKSGTFLDSTETAKYSSSSGIFIVPDVSIDGITYFEAVTLQFNVTNGSFANQANGTFTLLDARPKDTSFSNIPLDTLRLGGLKIDFFGCSLSGLNQISCKMNLVSSATGGQEVLINQKQGIQGKNASAPPLSLFDNLGQGYRASFVSILDQTEEQLNTTLIYGVPTVVTDQKTGEQLSTTLIQGVPTEVTLVYDGFNIHATSISVFKPDFLSGMNFLGQFANSQKSIGGLLSIPKFQRIIGDFRDIDF